VAQFEECCQLMEMEKARCKKMSIELMAFIKQMVIDAEKKQ
jgi:hypothetical protein